MQRRNSIGWMIAGLAIVAVRFFLQDSNWFYQVIPDALWQLDDVFIAVFHGGWGYVIGSLVFLWGAYLWLTAKISN